MNPAREGAVRIGALYASIIAFCMFGFISSGLAQTGNIVIDFEKAPGLDGMFGTADDVLLKDGDVISNQFSALGVTFSLVNGGFPRIAVVDGKFAGFWGNETGSVRYNFPAHSGLNSLSPGIDNKRSVQIDFAFPVRSVTMHELDFDWPYQPDALNLIAYDSAGNVVSRGSLVSPGFPFGDSNAYEITITAREIRRIVVDYAGTHDNGVAFDDLSYEFDDQPSRKCYLDSFSFGVDSWITSSPYGSVLADFISNGQTYPALTALGYGGGRAVYAEGSTFSELGNILYPGNEKHELFLNSVKWVTKGKDPAQTRALMTYGHRELLTYWNGVGCCSSNAIQAMRDAGYTVDVSFDVPLALAGYDAVVMPGIGWGGGPGYPNPVHWSSNGHALTSTEIAVLLDFVRNGGGLVTSVEAPYGAGWLDTVGSAMGVNMRFMSYESPLFGRRIIEHPILETACPNQPPIAAAGADQSVELTSCAAASVTLDGSGSSDPDGDALTSTWTWPGGSAEGASPTVTLPYGATTVTLTVDDGKGGTSTDEAVINVVDTTAPVLNVSLDPNVLWPPNHKYVTVGPSVTVQDACAESVVVELLSSTSSEPDDGLGDGDTADDIAVNADGTLSLRAERSGSGSGRTYTIRYQATDMGGNSTTAAATAVVPHDMGKK